MGQWGRERQFVNSSATIRVLPHIQTDSPELGPFTPIGPASTIDKLVLIDVQGSRDDGEALLRSVEEKFCRRPYSEWQNERAFEMLIAAACDLQPGAKAEPPQLKKVVLEKPEQGRRHRLLLVGIILCSMVVLAFGEIRPVALAAAFAMVTLALLDIALQNERP